MKIQKKFFIDVLMKRCSENIQRIYRRTPKKEATQLEALSMAKVVDQIRKIGSHRGSQTKSFYIAINARKPSKIQQIQ